LLEVVDGPLVNHVAYLLQKMSKFVRRVLSFFAPSSSSSSLNFATLPRRAENAVYARVGCRLLEVLLLASEQGKSLVKSHKLLRELQALLAHEVDCVRSEADGGEAHDDGVMVRGRSDTETLLAVTRDGSEGAGSPSSSSGAALAARLAAQRRPSPAVAAASGIELTGSGGRKRRGTIDEGNDSDDSSSEPDDDRVVHRLLGPRYFARTQARDYFAMLGVLTSTHRGLELMKKFVSRARTTTCVFLFRRR
jgi:hypothetical protein